MAKRKRKPTGGSGSKLQPVKIYHDDQYLPYIFRTEVGILEAWTIDPDLRDGDVRQALRSLTRSMKRTGQLPPELVETSEEKSEDITLLEFRILSNLQIAFEKYGALNVEDTIGILKVVNHSVGTWNRGMRGQEYLKFIQGFLGRMGVQVRQLSEEEVEKLAFELPGDLDETHLAERKKLFGLS